MTITRMIPALFAISLFGCALESDTYEPDVEEFGADDDDLPLTIQEGASLEVVCSDYCTDYATGCFDNVYEDRQDCLDTCGAWPLGASVNSSRDDAYCHGRHAARAAEFAPYAGSGFGGHGNPTIAAACAAASPRGGVCGALESRMCDDYCDGYIGSCSGVGFASRTACMTWCDGEDLGIDGGQEGDTIQCRLGFVRGAESDPETYCDDAAPASAACVDV